MQTLRPDACTGIPTAHLKLSSGNGPVYRTVLKTPLRDALPAEIPVIDISGVFSDSLRERTRTAQQIHNAAANNGFFYISNHGIPSTVTHSAHSACLEFFRQPMDIKMRADSNESKYFNGYKPPNSQRINSTESIDVRETFSWTYDPLYDPSVSDVNLIPPHIARHMRSEEYAWHATSNMPQFKDAVVRYWQHCLLLARALVRSFALSLSLPENSFDTKFSHPDAALALNYYPSIQLRPSTDNENELVSIGSHTDFQLFTILWQDDNGGLQVLSREGQWLRAPPIPGTLVVNIGDYLQRITNDKYVSTVHRAQNCSGKERISMPFFFGFNLNESCGVLDTCVNEGEVKKYTEISCRDWVQRRVKSMHQVDSD